MSNERGASGVTQEQDAVRRVTGATQARNMKEGGNAPVPPPSVIVGQIPRGKAVREPPLRLRRGITSYIPRTLFDAALGMAVIVD